MKLNLQKTKIVASGSITSWQIEGEKVKAMTDFIFLGSKTTADGDCSPEIKRRLLLGKKSMTNLDSVLKRRDITLPEYSLEGLLLKLKLLYLGHLMQNADSLEKTLMLGKIKGRKRMRQQRTRWLDGIIDTMDVSLGKLRDTVEDREASPAAVHGVTKSQTQFIY